MPDLDDLSEIRYYPTEINYKAFDWLYWASILNFNMEAQPQSNWCWAATAKSVSRYYCIFSPWTQCKIASEELGLTCCTSPVPGPCNVPWYLDRALTRTKNFVSIHNGTLSWTAVRAELAAGRVVGARQGWSDGGGHFMVIHGVSRTGSTRYFHIDDPIYGKSVLTVNQFSTNYQGSGTWTHYYLTKIQHYRPMWLEDILIDRRLLRVIPEARPLLRLQKPTLNIHKNFNEVELRFPHPCYQLGLSQIGKEINLPDQVSCLRVIEIEDNVPIASYDLSTAVDKPELIQLNADQNYLDHVISGLEKLKKAATTADKSVQLRTLRVPALNIEALWIKKPGKNNDQFYLTRSFNEQETIYSEKHFFSLLRTLKSAVDKQDDTMGA